MPAYNRWIWQWIICELTGSSTFINHRRSRGWVLEDQSFRIIILKGRKLSKPIDSQNRPRCLNSTIKAPTKTAKILLSLRRHRQRDLLSALMMEPQSVCCVKSIFTSFHSFHCYTCKSSSSSSTLLSLISSVSRSWTDRISAMQS